ncbi:MAG TPA: hypothetical protein VG055_16685 [Planctomycetaceae bacterium]|nr:hypothetical protein [Planctomycetaceae bacterium]
MRLPVFRWYLAAFFTFWGTVAAVDSITYLVGDKGPGGGSTILDAMLAIPLYLGLIAGGCLHAIAVVKTATQYKSAAGVLLSLFGGTLFGVLNFVAYVIVTFWFVIDVMQWDSL